MSRVVPMERWWTDPLGAHAEEGFPHDACIHDDCSEKRSPGKPSCPAHFCLKCLGYGFVCGNCGEGPAMCVCHKVDEQTCSDCPVAPGEVKP